MVTMAYGVATVEGGGGDASRDHWRAYDTLPIGACVATSTGVICHANPTLCAHLGLAVAHAVGRTLESFHGADGASRPGLRALRGGDGGERWFAETTQPVQGPAGEAMRLHLFTDIDAQVRRDIALQGRVAQMDALFDILPVPTFIKDARGVFTACNQAFERYTGLKRDTLLGKTSFAMMRSGVAQAHVEQDRLLLGADATTRYEEAVPLADGNLRLIDLSKASFRDGLGAPGGIVGVVHDLTESQPYEARLEAILEQSPIGVSVSRRDDGRIVFVNTRFAELIGLSRDQLIGSRARDYYLDDHQRQRVLERLRGNGAVVNMEVQFKKADGSPFWTLFTVNQAVIQGAPVNLAWIYDYTERRNMEEALRDMASRDPLTGIYNRRSFMELARQQLARAHRFHEPLAVFVLDVDHFKKINDTYGHATGDDALRMVAGGCQAILREYDVLGRLGGEEFVVVLPGATADETRVVAERVRRNLARMAIPAPGTSFHLTTSIGIAGLEGASDSLEKAIHRADLALYRAKREGRNRVVVYEPGMQSV